MSKNRQEFHGTFFQEITIDRKKVGTTEAAKEGINVYAKRGEPLLTGKIDKPVTIKSIYTGMTFTGNVDDLLKKLNESEADESSDSSPCCTPTG